MYSLLTAPAPRRSRTGAPGPPFGPVAVRAAATAVVLPPGPGQAAGRQLLGGTAPARALPPSCLHLLTGGGELKGLALMFVHRWFMSEGPVHFSERRGPI